MIQPPRVKASEPARVLGPIDATCVVIGGIIGVGIFFTPSSVVKATGSGAMALAAWALGGLIAMCGALAFAELGARRTGPGAHYTILKDSYGSLPAFLYIFCNATAIQPGVIGIIALVCAKNLGIAAAGAEPVGWRLMALATALIVVLTAANIIGVRQGSRIQNLTVLCKLLALVAIVGLAVVLPPSRPATGVDGALPLVKPETGWGAARGILTALVAAFFSYGGWQHGLAMAGEIRDAARAVPRAIVVGVAIVVAVYLSANWAYLRLLGEQGVAASGALAADAVAAAAPGVGRRMIGGAVAVSAFGVLNAQLLSGPRLVHGMASDGLFFRPFARLSGRFGTPAAAIALLGSIGLGLLLLAGEKGIDRLLNGVMTIDGLFLGLTGAGVFMLRRWEGRPRPGLYRVPLYPLVPAVFVVGELGVVAGTFLNRGVRSSAVIAGLWIAGAGMVYLAAFRRRPGEEPAEVCEADAGERISPGA